MVKQLKHNLLGLPAIKGLHLLSVLDNLECDPTTAIKQELISKFIYRAGDNEIQPFSLGTAMIR